MNEPIRFALTNGGEIAKQCWMNIPKHYPNVLLHEFAILPDHIHGIIEIRNNGINEAGYKKTRHHEFQKIIPRSVGSIVRGYKIGVTKWFHENVPSDRVWQRNYHERIIRSKIEYQRITKYIRDNPKNWTPSPFPRRGSKF